MPSFSNDGPYQSTTTATATHPRPFDSPQAKPHVDKASVGNTFLWTNWPNGDTSHLDSQSTDRDPKNGSAYSLNGPRSSASSYTRDLPHSKDGSMHSLANGSVRDPRESGRFSMTMDKDFTRKSSDAGASAGIGSAAVSVSSAQQVNGISSSLRTPNGKSLVSADRPQPSVDELVAQNSTVTANGNSLSASLPEDTSRLASEPDRLSPSQAAASHRYSSPPLPSAAADASRTQDPAASGLRHRHTLQVPRATSGRRNSRDQADETAYSSGRLSPTAGGIRRTSLSLVRRATKTNHSDSVPDDANQNEDAARWAEAIKQRRASRRKRRDDDDDDRVIVGTKVDQNHVNYVTAYNMLTGIRFTVSRINAKMDRELTPADFQAKHKFSFDMYADSHLPFPFTILLIG
jgi:1-phosphatidylinositol-4-phosphate 5-kinase